MMKCAPSVLFAAVALCSCAGGPAGGASPVGALEAGARVFLSPSGEPFRPSATGASPLAAWFAGADADRSGDLSRTELRADAERFFQRLDLNRDGVIGDPEIQAYERDIAPEIAPDFGRRAGQQTSDGAGAEDGILRLPDNDGRGGGRGRSRGASVLSLLQQSQPVLAADYDQSQSVTREEFGRAADARFDRLDAAGDGRLILSELRAIRVAPAWTGGRRRSRRR